jgi:hypothetical protein
MSLLEDRLAEAVHERKHAPDSTAFVRAFAREKVLRRQLEEKEFTAEKRQALADKGHALPEGGFPIENASDLANAVKALGRATNPDAARRHIIKRARELKLVSSLPDSWNVKDGNGSSSPSPPPPKVAGKGGFL